MSTESPIRSARLKKRLTQAQLAKRLGITKQTVCDWEKGRSAPRTKLVPMLVKELRPHISYESLLGRAA